MSNTLQKQNLLRWFSYLHALQSACSFNTSIQAMDLLTFANTTITGAGVLPSNNEQQQFINSAKVSPGFDISQADLTAYATFEALLDYFNPLPTYIAAYIQTVAAPPYPSGSMADFLSALASGAFPGGSQAAPWSTAIGLLGSAIPAVCFTAKLQASVGKTVDGATKKVSDIVNQIATLG